MSECEKGVSRRTVLLAAAGGGAGAGADDHRSAGQDGAGRRELSDGAEGRQAVRRCNFFIAPNACKMVDGDISPTGYCILWVKKAA